MLTTSNYGLKKPEGTDVVDIQNFNDNVDIIDTNMKAINDNSYPNVTATGTNAYVGSTDRIKALGKGTKLTLFVAVDATANCTLNLNSYGVKNIKDSFGNIVTNLKKDIPYNLCYNGTDFILQGKGGGGNVTADKMLNGVTATGDNGPVVGNIPSKAAATYTPSTLTQTISALQYLLGPQTIAGDANLISANIRAGASIFGIAGKPTVVDTSDAVLDPQYLLAGYSGYDDGVKKDGTMINRSGENWHQPAAGQTVSDANGYGAYVIPPRGFYDGNSWVRSLQPDLLAANIISGKSIFGLAGSAPNVRMLSGTTNAYFISGYLDVINFASFLPFTPRILFGKLTASGKTTTFAYINDFGLWGSFYLDPNGSYSWNTLLGLDKLPVGGWSNVSTPGIANWTALTW